MGSLVERWTKRLAAAGPWLVLPAVGAAIAEHWDSWPAEHPVHWGLSGPDELIERTPHAVVAPLLVAAALLAWLEVVRAHVLRYADPVSDGGRALRVVGFALRAVQWTLAVMGGALALPSLSPAPSLVAVGLALTLVPMGLVLGYSGSPAPPPARRPPPGGWLYVPRGFGIGFAISRGHPGARRAWMLILGPPLAILALARLFLA